MLYGDILRERLQGLRIEKEMRDRGEDPRTRLKTGLKSFDEKVGIERGCLTVVGAPTGEGKSIFAKHLQETTAKNGGTAMLLSFEDPPERFAERTFSTLTGIDNDDFPSGRYDDFALARIEMELQDVEWADRIELHFGLTSPEEALRLVQESTADLVQLDYAQAFMDGDKGLTSIISDLAWEMNVDAQRKKRTNVVYSQLGRQVDARGMKEYNDARFKDRSAICIDGWRPHSQGDLAWSESLGQKAKGLIFLFRPNRYLRRWGVDVKDNRMELICPKKNFGKEGKVTVGFDGATASLYDLNERDDERNQESRDGNDERSGQGPRDDHGGGRAGRKQERLPLPR